MPPKTSFVTEQHIRSTPLPNHGKTYSVISHGAVIDETRQNLQNAGLTIQQELYKSSLDGQIAQGIYHLVCNQDPDMGMMFAWANSYNRLTRFKCAIGGRVFVCDNGMVNGDISSYSRVHKGTGAWYSVKTTIEDQIANASSYFNRLVVDKEMFKPVFLTRGEQASMLGRLYAEHDALTIAQVSMVRKEMDKPSFDYGVDPRSAWALYNHVTLALKESHPGSYLKDHETVHRFFVNEVGHLIGNGYDQEDNPSYIGMDEELFETGTVVLAEPGTIGISNSEPAIDISTVAKFGVTFS